MPPPSRTNGLPSNSARNSFLRSSARRHFGNLAVLPPVVVLGPGVEMKMDNGAVSAFRFPLSAFLTKIGPLSRIQPRLVGWTMNWTLLQIAARPLEMTGGELLFGLMPDQKTHGFARRDFAHHFAINPADGLHLARPVGLMMRPGEPRCRMRLPFGGHGVARARRGWRRWRFLVAA